MNTSKRQSPTSERVRDALSLTTEPGGAAHVRTLDVIDAALEADPELVPFLVEGYSQKWIARQLGVSEPTVTRRMKRLRLYLERQLQS